MLFPSFEGAKKLIEDLDLPRDPEEIFCSRVIGGGEYIRATGAAYQQYQKYSVELFGRILPSDQLTAIKPFPSLSSSNGLTARYWSESPTNVIQIWRTRVFAGAIEKLNISLTNPLSPYRPNFPYLEERWHPQLQQPNITLGGLDHFSVGFRLLEKFYNTAHKILTRSSPQKGRPPGTGLYSSAEDFYQAVRKVHSALWKQLGRKPLQKEVAFKMSMKLSAFKKYCAKAGLSWDYLSAP